MKKDIFDELCDMKKDKLAALRTRLDEIHNTEELVKCVENPNHFLEQYATIQHPTKGAVLFVTYEYQKNLIHSFRENRFNIVHGARQVGLTSTTAMYTFSYAFFEPHKTIIIASDKLANSKDILCRIRFAYESLPEWLKDGNPLVVKNKTRLEFKNGSRIFAVSSDPHSIRGISADLVVLDNFAFLSHRKQEEFYMTVMPTIHQHGSLIISSTTAPAPGLFKDIWDDAIVGKNAFVPHHIKWDVIPGRDDDFKDSMVNIIGQRRWNVEYECTFND